MPRLLRRAAPSPSVDELAFASPAPSLTATMSFSEGAFKCPVHGAGLSRSSSGGRRRSLNSSETENSSGSSSEERDSREENLAATAAAAAAEVDAEQQQRASGSLTCSCSSASLARSRASQGSSKRISTRLEDLAATVVEEDDVNTAVGPGDQDTDNESCCSHDRELTCHKCEMLYARESVSSSTSSRVVIRDTQLAALDVEIQNLRKTFVRSMYARLTSVSKRLGKRNGTQQIAAS